MVFTNQEVCIGQRLSGSHLKQLNANSNAVIMDFTNCGDGLYFESRGKDLDRSRCHLDEPLMRIHLLLDMDWSGCHLDEQFGVNSFVVMVDSTNCGDCL